MRDHHVEWQSVIFTVSRYKQRLFSYSFYPPLSLSKVFAVIADEYLKVLINRTINNQRSNALLET